MFDAKMVGKNISKFRKENNMTQLELADKIDVSFQAVSNWELGKTMPDIVKLPVLAEIFKISIDELLGKQAEVIESVVKSNVKECIDNGIISLHEISDISCVLKPDQIAVIAESERIEDLPDIEELLPFLNSDVINSLAMKAANNKKYQDLNILAPFVSKNVIDDIALKMINEGENITNIAPFIGKDTMFEITEELYKKYGIKSLYDVAPFMQKEQIAQFVEKDYEISGHYCWELITPYVDRKELDIYMQNLIQKDKTR